LLIPLWPRIGLASGMRKRQARPERLYPPIPRGQASDQHTLSGSRVTKKGSLAPRGESAPGSLTRGRGRIWPLS
jgi:hypothetical protein